MARRNKKEPFNPFAPGASNKSQKKVQKPRTETVSKKSANISRQEQIEAMRRKIREKQEEREKDKISAAQKELVIKPKIEPESDKINEVSETDSKVSKEQETKPTTIKNNEIKKDNKISLTENKSENKYKNSQQNNKVKSNVESTPKNSVKPQSLSKLEDLKRRSDALAAKTGIKLPETENKGTLFNTKGEINIDKKVKKAPKSVRKTKKGGGKQPKQQKLNRRKQLEFRFDARAILDNSEVAEEHRSNIFGQIWAKGERIGVQSANEYISQKEQEGILPSEISEELRALIKNYTIKR